MPVGRWRSALLMLILLAPSALAATPAKELQVPYSLGGQELTDLGLDPTGQFATAVVNVDSQKSVNNLLPGAEQHRDIYACDFGPADRQGAGSGCRGINHAPGASTSLGRGQVVDVTSTSRQGLLGMYAVGGPGNLVSLWTASSDSAVWEKAVPNDLVPVDVAISATGHRVFAVAAPATVEERGRLAMFEASNGTIMWEHATTDAQGNPVRPTALDYSREGGIVVVGTTNGVLLYDADGGRPTGSDNPGRLTQPAHVHHLQLSRDGSLLVVAASNGVFYAPLIKEGGKVRTEPTLVYNRQLGEAVTDAAVSLDGSRFVAVAGGKLHFFQREPNSRLATPIGQPFDAGAKIVDVAMDGKGALVVAITEQSALGFGVGESHTPIWTLPATSADFGGLDAPLRKVAVSDGGERFVLGGKTRIMPFYNTVKATAALAPATGNGTLTPAVERTLVLTLTNAGSLPDNYTFIVKRPVGWDGRNPDPLALNPEQSGTINLTVTPRAGEAPGVYSVTVEVRSQSRLDAGRSDPIVARAMANLTVPRAVSLVVEAPDERFLLRQGEERTVPVTIRNQGNAGGVVNLTATQELSRGGSWDLRFSQSQVTVEAGASASVDLLVTAPSDAGSGDRNVVTVRAREGGHEATDTITAYADARFGADLTTSNSTLLFAPGDIRTINVRVRNTGNTEDTFNLTHSITPASAQNDWSVTLDREQLANVARGDSRVVSVTIKPRVAEPEDGTLTIKAESQSDPERREDSLVLTLLAKEAEEEEDGGNFLPGPGPLLVLGVVALAALARRAAAGGRR